MPKVKEKGKKIEEPLEEKKVESNLDKQMYWVFGVMILIIVLFLFGVSLKNKVNSIDYNGLKFQKEMFGNIPLYRYTYLTDKSITPSGDVVRTDEKTTVNVFLRNDPRKINVPVTGKIEYAPKEQFVYVTISPEVSCQYSVIAMASLGSFLSQNGFTVKGGSSDEKNAQENKIDYITCENHPERMVVSLVAGEQSSIVREGNCYTITVVNCDVLPPVEKFIVQSILDARETKEK